MAVDSLQGVCELHAQSAYRICASHHPRGKRGIEQHAAATPALHQMRRQGRNLEAPQLGGSHHGWETFPVNRAGRSVVDASSVRSRLSLSKNPMLSSLLGQGCGERREHIKQDCLAAILFRRRDRRCHVECVEQMGVNPPKRGGPLAQPDRRSALELRHALARVPRNFSPHARRRMRLELGECSPAHARLDVGDCADLVAKIHPQLSAKRERHMSRRLTFVSGLSALCLWTATIIPANAVICRARQAFSTRATARTRPSLSTSQSWGE